MTVKQNNYTGPEEKGTILIVEDSDVNRVILQNLLVRNGYTAWTMGSGHEALEKLEQELPDLIVLDIMMPGMDGFALCEQIKQNEQAKAIPVIFISSLDQTEDKLAGFEAGAVDYITKPFQPAEVLARFSTHLKLCRLQRELKERNRQLEEEKQKSEALLRNVLPAKVAEELIETGRCRPLSFDAVTVCFIDIIEFTRTASNLEAKLVISELNDIFTAFDAISEKYECERMKTIGDAYLFVCGVPETIEDHASRVVCAAREMVAFLQQRNQGSTLKWEVRVGIHSGGLVGGIVGTEKYLYDIFGDTVNIASRMEKLAPPMHINLSESAYLLTRDQFSFIERGVMDVKGKGRMPMYLIDEKVDTKNSPCR